MTIKDLLEVKKLLIFCIQKVRTECDLLVYLCLCSDYERTTKKIFEKKMDSSTQFLNNAIETLFLLEKVRIAKEEFLPRTPRHFPIHQKSHYDLNHN